MTLLQRSLFPDAYEVQDEALAALEDLRVEQAQRSVARARERDARLVGLDLVERALSWLAPRLGGREPDEEAAAQSWRELPAARSRAELPPDSAASVDGVLARFLLRRSPAARPFVDRAERVHRGALQLVVARPAPAREGLLETLSAGQRERADLWSYLGDACFLAERPYEANACYVRALVIAAQDVDLMRLREPRLAELFGRLSSTHPQAVARELLLTQAWIEGLLTIPPGNGWIEAARVSALLAATTEPGPAPERRYRRLGLLVYRDRSRLPGAASLDERSEMLELDPELFRRYLGTCRARERAGTPALTW